MIIAIIVGFICVVLIALGPLMSRVETPQYTVIQSDKNVEVRFYPPMVVAEVQVSGPRQEAIKKGFRLLADYIFGNNRVRKDIAMTAPVQQQAHEKIAMTAPVQQQGNEHLWQVRFVMPSEYTLETLPQPVNDRIVLASVPEKKFAVIRFSGTYSDENMKAHERKLMAYVQANALSVIGAPTYAFYNPPWTLPFMRRNEVMIELD